MNTREARKLACLAAGGVIGAKVAKRISKEPNLTGQVIGGLAGALLGLLLAEAVESLNEVATSAKEARERNRDIG